MSNTKKTTHSSDTCRSFIPYLQTRCSQELKIRLAVRDASLGGQTAPFLFMKSAGPLAAVLPATLCVDGQLSGTDFFLLLQPDTYATASSELQPLTNPDVEQLWEETLNRYRAGGDGPCQMIPMSQWDEKHGWVPFEPILYCSRTDQYCPTLCPLCGRQLVLCRDDTMLAEAGLQPFSTTPERYLHCPDCHQQSAISVFYTRGLAGDPGAGLRDCRGLVSEYGKLLTRADLEENLPCVGCKHCDDCFGPGNLVSTRMVPLNFFPFHALLQPAPTLNLLDFIPLLGGFDSRREAQISAVQGENHRLKPLEHFQETYGQESGFLFQDDDRHFLEVLYLKLTLLQTLFEAGLRNPTLFREPVGNMSLEGFWVHLDKRSHGLPYLWGFDLQMVDAVGWPQQHDLNSHLARSQARYFMGHAWFYILLSNARQDFKKVQAVLSSRLDNGNSRDRELFVSDDPADPLAPGSIFWSETPVTFDPQWNALWKQSLTLGVSLLRSGLSADATWSDQEFEALLCELRNEVRHSLFQAPGTAKVGDTKVGGSDQQIAAIVGAILQQWPAGDIEEEQGRETEPVLPEETAAQSVEDGDIEETIILGSEDTLPGIPPPEGEASQGTEIHRTSFPLTSEDEEQTVVISPPSVPAGEFDPDQTLVIGGSLPSAGDTPQAPVSRTSGQSPEDDMDRTVIISPEPSVPGRGFDPEQTVVSRPPDHGPGEELDKTVVISPASSTPAAGKDSEQTLVHRPPVPPPEDDPERTVVISPPSMPTGDSDLEETVLMGGKVPSPHDDPDKTVIINRNSHGGAPERKTEDATPPGKADGSKTAPEDDLEATLIMDPGSGKNRKPRQ